MSNRTLSLTPELYTYLQAHSLREPPALARLREETAAMEGAVMQIAPEQGQFMALLLRLMEARRVLEIGTYTGYSTLWLAGALPADGEVVTCDISREWTDVARRHWQAAGLAQRITLHLGPARETLHRLLREGAAGTFDFAFIDADKTGYDAYYEACLDLVRPGGLIAVDNTLWDGAVADPAADDADTRAIRRFNDKVHADPRVELSLVPIGDGLTLALRRAG